MSRDPRYQRLLNSKRWWEVKRIVWQRANGLCEECKRQGYVTPGVDCHHIVPVESAHSVQEMERLCYDYEHNIRLLCVACHIKVHQEQRSHTTDELKANRQRRTDRWAEAMEAKFMRKTDDKGDNDSQNVNNS